MQRTALLSITALTLAVAGFNTALAQEVPANSPFQVETATDVKARAERRQLNKELLQAEKDRIAAQKAAEIEATRKAEEQAAIAKAEAEAEAAAAAARKAEEAAKKAKEALQPVTDGANTATDAIAPTPAPVKPTAPVAIEP